MKPLAGAVVTAAQMRAAEFASGIPLDVLMERAGVAVAETAWRWSSGAPMLIVCGPGNNGGDGYVAARLLAARGADVRVAASAPPATDLSRAARLRWRGPVEAIETARPAETLVDALFGTGLSRPLEPGLATSLARLRHAARLTLAVDVPSGVGSDDGADLGTAGADITLALGAAKPAHLLQPAAALCGRVVVADLGIAIASDAAVLETPRLRPPTAADHKYTRGLVVVVAGAMRGAAALTATAAARAGAGYVILVGEPGELPRSVVVRPRADLDEVLSHPRVGAVVIGPGLGSAAPDILARVLATRHRLVLDADALRPGLPIRDAPTVITPHADEFVRMFGDLAGSKLDRARAASTTSGAILVYKGSDTVIASPGGRATLTPGGRVWLSTAGTGDVLAGVVAAMLARGLDAHDAASAAVWLHLDAARRAGPGLIADDLLDQLQASLAAATTSV